MLNMDRRICNITELLDKYYRENGRKLHEKVDKILSDFGGITKKDYDDFYSIANEVFVDVLKKYEADNWTPVRILSSAINEHLAPKGWQARIMVDDLPILREAYDRK